MHELLTPAQHDAADAKMVARGYARVDLIERAGAEVAETVARYHPHGPILVLCGPGANGGDGYVAARLLAERERSVQVARFGPTPTGCVSQVAACWLEPVTTATPQLIASFAGDGIIVDALLGAGINRDLDAELLALVDAVNAHLATVLAVDIPTGVDGTTGALRGGAVKADRTVTFFRCKPGHMLMPALEYCGVVELTDIGFPDELATQLAQPVWANHPDLAPVPPRMPAGHKYHAGHCVVVSGPRWRTGAARLAARAALRAGAGAVTIVGGAAALDEHAAQLNAVMLAEVDGANDLARFVEDRRIDAVVMGPALGITDVVRAKINLVLGTEVGLVLDADAITSIADDAERQFERLADRTAATILTPHEAEFLRLFPDLTAGSKIERTVAAAKRANATVVHKGADTVIAAPDGRVIVNNAPATLATAGTGDVLAGMIGAMLAQALAPFEAAAAGVWLHSQAARRGPKHLVATDLLVPFADPAKYDEVSQ